MSTRGEDLTAKLVVEAADVCSGNCNHLANKLLELAFDVDAGELDPDKAFSAYGALLRGCPVAVETMAINPTDAQAAWMEIKSIAVDRGQKGEPPKCALITVAENHAYMYARDMDPFSGWLEP